MRYLLLIYNNPTKPATEAELEALTRGHTDLYRELADAGVVVSSAALAAPPVAATVQVRDGVPAVTDGPYLEAKEYLAGYYLVECDTIEHAIEIATRIPCGVYGTVEVRPVDETTTRAVRGEN